MRAIIITDAEARSLLDQLELTNMRGANHFRQNMDKPATTEEVHRAFHYVVCQWLQEMGCDVVRRG